ncbi:hypothetical protein EL17_00070 [Anditalea andensis]|uniref:Uncharacterized protein n=1 Tax=Anditalea andensis TaxID=1048983 RepID=A0A074L7W3_9BACT|nr:hypothetical protein EL17_00070 [Anditalea andensis]
MNLLNNKYNAIKYLYLVFIFSLILIFNYLIFLENIFTWPLFLYSFFNFIVILINFYTLYFIFFIKNLMAKLFFIIMGLILFYFVSLYFTTVPLKSLKDLYPHNSRIYLYYNTLYINKIKDLFSISNLAWMTSQLYFHLILLTLGVLMDKYLNSIKNVMEL